MVVLEHLRALGGCIWHPCSRGLCQRTNPFFSCMALQLGHYAIAKFLQLSSEVCDCTPFREHWVSPFLVPTSNAEVASTESSLESPVVS